MKAAFLTLGCKVNYYETEKIMEQFRLRGYEVVEFSEPADIYIINTCTVTNMADRKSRQMIHRAKRKNPDSLVVAVGCYVESGKEVLEKDEAVDAAFSNKDKEKLADLDYRTVPPDGRRACQGTAGRDGSCETPHPGISESPGWMQPVLHLLYDPLCERPGRIKKHAGGQGAGRDKGAGGKGLQRGSLNRDPFVFLWCGLAEREKFCQVKGTDAS